MPRRGLAIVSLVAIGAITAAYTWLLRAGEEMTSLRPGMVVLHLPSGATAYLRRQAHSGKQAEVYISSNGDFCAPYDRWHDYKLPPAIQGGPESPVLISYSGNTVIVHSPEPLRIPWLTQPGAFRVTFQALPPAKYAEYIGTAKGISPLPEKWVRVEIPFGHNTCAL